MTKAPLPTREAMRERMRVSDEWRLSYELGSVAEAMSARIIEKHEGAAAGEAQVSGISDMCHALQRALVDGGRAAYDMELARWTGREYYDEFRLRMDYAMTRMP